MWYGIVALAFVMIAGSLGYTQLTGLTTGNLLVQLETENRTALGPPLNRWRPRVAGL
jgi:hypothetical protein